MIIVMIIVIVIIVIAIVITIVIPRRLVRTQPLPRQVAACGVSLALSPRARDPWGKHMCNVTTRVGMKQSLNKHKNKKL